MSDELTWRTKDSSSLICILIALILIGFLYTNFNNKQNFYKCLEENEGNRLSCTQEKFRQLENQMRD